MIDGSGAPPAVTGSRAGASSVTVPCAREEDGRSALRAYGLTAPEALPLFSKIGLRGIGVGIPPLPPSMPGFNQPGEVLTMYRIK